MSDPKEEAKQAALAEIEQAIEATKQAIRKLTLKPAKKRVRKYPAKPED